MSNLMIGEIGENHQFKNEINKIIGHHKGKLTLSDTSVGRVVVKSMPEEKSIYCCFEVEMKKSDQQGRKERNNEPKIEIF